MENALTIDVEDFFHVAAFERSIDRSAWDGFRLRVEDNTRAILDLLDEFEVKGTFFVLGWVAKRRPGLVREIQRRGHEIASHGYGHERIYLIGPDRFREDLRRAKGTLEDICAVPVRGFRAPSFSIVEASAWALDVLIEEGFAYDSSLFPIYHDLYGMRGIPSYPHEIRRAGGSIREFPMSTIELRLPGKGLRVPVAGGGYLRLFPLWFIRKAIRRINGRDGQPAVLYFHPWEIDPGQPRVRAGFKSRFRHYCNLSRTRGKIRGLLEEFSFAPMGQVLGLA